MTGNSRIERLPNAVIAEIMQKMSLQDIASLAQTSKTMNKQVNGMYGKSAKDQKQAAATLNKLTKQMNAEAGDLETVARMLGHMPGGDAKDILIHAKKYLTLVKATGGFGEETINELQKRVRKEPKVFAPELVSAAKTFKSAKDRLKKAITSVTNGLKGG